MDINNLPPGWDEADEDMVEDLPWEDSTHSEDDSSVTSEKTSASSTSLNMKLIVWIAGVFVVLAITYVGGMFVFDMFSKDEESSGIPSCGANIGGVANSGESRSDTISNKAKSTTQSHAPKRVNLF